MSDESKNVSQKPDDAPQTGSNGLIWIFALTLTLLFVGGIYFDAHSGWFDSQVYAPYKTADELASYQPVSGAAAVLAQGKKAYETTCGICHGTDGLGKPGQYPPLAGSEWVNEKGDKRLLHVPLEGLSGDVHVKNQDWNSSMAAMGAGLSDSDLAAALTYVRSSWGNNAPPVTAGDVKAVRAEAAGKPAVNGETGLNAIKE